MCSTKKRLFVEDSLLVGDDTLALLVEEENVKLGYSPKKIERKTFFEKTSRFYCITKCTRRIHSQVAFVTVNSMPETNKRRLNKYH